MTSNVVLVNLNSKEERVNDLVETVKKEVSSSGSYEVGSLGLRFEADGHLQLGGLTDKAKTFKKIEGKEPVITIVGPDEFKQKDIPNGSVILVIGHNSIDGSKYLGFDDAIGRAMKFGSPAIAFLGCHAVGEREGKLRGAMKFGDELCPFVGGFERKVDKPDIQNSGLLDGLRSFLWDPAVAEGSVDDRRWRVVLHMTAATLAKTTTSGDPSVFLNFVAPSKDRTSFTKLFRMWKSLEELGSDCFGSYKEYLQWHQCVGDRSDVVVSNAQEILKSAEADKAERLHSLFSKHLDKFRVAALKEALGTPIGPECMKKDTKEDRVAYRAARLAIRKKILSGNISEHTHDEFFWAFGNGWWAGEVGPVIHDAYRRLSSGGANAEAHLANAVKACSKFWWCDVRDHFWAEGEHPVTGTVMKCMHRVSGEVGSAGGGGGGGGAGGGGGGGGAGGGGGGGGGAGGDGK